MRSVFSPPTWAITLIGVLQIQALLAVALPPSFNLSPLPDLNPLDDALTVTTLSSDFIPKSNHIFIRRGKFTDRAASAAAILMQYRSVKEHEATALKKEQERDSRKSEQEWARSGRAAVQARRLAIIAQRPPPTLAQIMAEAKEAKANEIKAAKSAATRARKIETKSKAVEAVRLQAMIANPAAAEAADPIIISMRQGSAGGTGETQIV